MSIGKPEAIKRLIETCIKMIALGLDPVATHVVVMASVELLRSYSKSVGSELALDEDRFIVAEHRQEWRRARVRAYNFFKHSDRDAAACLPLEVLKGLPTVNELQTLGNTQNYHSMFGEWPDGGGTFIVISMVLYPEIFDTDRLFVEHPELQEAFRGAQRIERTEILQELRVTLQRQGFL